MPRGARRVESNHQRFPCAPSVDSLTTCPAINALNMEREDPEIPLVYGSHEEHSDGHSK